MKKLNVIGWLCMVLWLLASCSSSKVATNKSLSELEGESIVTGLIANAPNYEAIDAKMKFNLHVNGKDISVGGNLRMKKDDVIQLSLVGFGIIEGGRIEFTKDEVLIMDRINKQYIRVPYAELDFLSNAGIDFFTLQALFWNELIVPGVEHVSTSELSSFTVKKEDAQAVLMGKSTRKLSYRFYASLEEGVLEKTEISAKSPYCLDWSYRDFKTVEGKSFPSVMDIRMEGLKKETNVQIRLGSISTDTDWETRTKVSKKYKEVTVDDILSHIMKLK